jgi:SARP family transcriptional regulator, regulator of embCAB operon
MQFQILGPLRVSDGNEREIALGGDKPAALLAMLVLRPNEAVPSDRLIEDLWDGHPPATAAKTLQVHMSRCGVARRSLTSRMRRSLAPPKPREIFDGGAATDSNLPSRCV